jgi:hypothetical protein
MAGGGVPEDLEDCPPGDSQGVRLYGRLNILSSAFAAVALVLVFWIGNPTYPLWVPITAGAFWFSIMVSVNAAILASTHFRNGARRAYPDPNKRADVGASSLGFVLSILFRLTLSLCTSAFVGKPAAEFIVGESIDEHIHSQNQTDNSPLRLEIATAARAQLTTVATALQQAGTDLTATVASLISTRANPFNPQAISLKAKIADLHDKERQLTLQLQGYQHDAAEWLRVAECENKGTRCFNPFTNKPTSGKPGQQQAYTEAYTNANKATDNVAATGAGLQSVKEEIARDDEQWSTLVSTWNESYPKTILALENKQTELNAEIERLKKIVDPLNANFDAVVETRLKAHMLYKPEPSGFLAKLDALSDMIWVSWARITWFIPLIGMLMLMESAPVVVSLASQVPTIYSVRLATQFRRRRNEAVHDAEFTDDEEED